MKKETTGKILKISIIVVFLISLVLVIWQFFFSASGTYALIYQDNKLLYEINLKETEPMEFTIEYSSGNTTGFNTISVKDGSIGIIDADCPDKVCEHMGMTSSTNFPITCLPHKLVIEIVDESEDTSGQPDVISH